MSEEQVPELAALERFNLPEAQKELIAAHLRALLPAEEQRRVSSGQLAERHRKRYWDHPADWARDCLKWPEGQGLTSYQREILEQLPVVKRLAVAGPRGLGKTCLASIAILWFVCTRDGYTDWIAPTTAGGYRQLEEFLFPELHKWVRRLRWDRIGRAPWNPKSELMKLSLDGLTGHAFAAASTRGDLIEGAHASQVLYVFDEGKAIEPSTWDSVEGVFSNAGTRGREAFMLAISTPGGKEGRFWAIFENKEGAYNEWTTRHVKLQEVLNEQMISHDWVEKRANQWGSDSALYKNHVLGEFAAPDEAGVIPCHWVEEAMLRSVDYDDSGISVAGAGARS